MRLEVSGTAAHGATPWLGENAILKAIDTFRAIESLPFARESSDLFDRPSINLGRILGGDALNKVPDRCVIDVDIRYLPGQDPAEIRQQVSDLPDVSLVSQFHREPAIVDRNDPYVRVLSESVSSCARHRDASASAATAPRTPSASSTPGCRRSSSARSEEATTAPPNGSLPSRCRATAARSWTSCGAFPTRSQTTSPT